MENRQGLIVDAQATIADGFAEREAATTMLSTHWRYAAAAAPDGGGRQSL
jgi:hypothetical protein